MTGARPVNPDVSDTCDTADVTPVSAELGPNLNFNQA
jgi:hypothetical protein